MNCFEDMKDELIGRTFRRNVYGLSVWEDTIQDVWFSWRLNNGRMRNVDVMVKGTVHSFPLKDILITNVPYTVGEKLYLDKQERYKLMSKSNEQNL